MYACTFTSTNVAYTRGDIPEQLSHTRTRTFTRERTSHDPLTDYFIVVCSTPLHGLGIAHPKLDHPRAVPHGLAVAKQQHRPNQPEVLVLRGRKGGRGGDERGKRERERE